MALIRTALDIKIAKGTALKYYHLFTLSVHVGYFPVWHSWLICRYDLSLFQFLSFSLQDYFSKNCDKTLPILTLTNCLFVLGVCVYVWMAKYISFGILCHCASPFWSAPSLPRVGCLHMYGCVGALLCGGGWLPRGCRQAPDGCRAEKGDDGHLAKFVAEDAGPAGDAAQG